MPSNNIQASGFRQNHAQKIWSNAQKHYQASRVGRITYSNNQNQKLNFCQCCHQPITKQQIPLDQNTKQFQIFGFGYPLYFSFLKYCLFLIFILIISRTGFILYTATKQNYQFCLKGSTFGLKQFYHPHKNIISPKKSSKQHHYISNPNVNHLSKQKEHVGTDDYVLHLSTRFSQTQNNHQSSTINHLQMNNHQISISQINENQNHMSENKGQKSGGQHAQCTSFMIYLSIFKGQSGYDNYFLRILAFIAHLVTLIVIRNQLLKQQRYFYEKTCTLSSYSIIVSNLPQKQGIRHMLFKLFQQRFDKKQKKQIQQIILIFGSSVIQQHDQQIRQLQQKQLKALTMRNYTQLNQIKQQIQNKTKSFNQKQIQQLKKLIQEDKIKCNKAIVIFNTQEDKAQVIKQYNKLYKRYKYFINCLICKTQDYQNIQQIKDLHNIHIKQAPQPNQIIWENIHISDVQRKWRIFNWWNWTLSVLIVITIIFLFILMNKTQSFVKASELQKQHPGDPQAKSIKNWAIFKVFAAMFGIVLFNKFILNSILHFFVHKQKHVFTDSQSFSFSMKYSLGMFFTTALMTLMVEAIVYQNFASHHFGVIEQQTIMFFVTAFFIPLIWLINPYYLAKKFKLWLNRNKIIPQKQANQLIEDFQYDLGKRYAQIFEIMWFTFLYSELIPLGSFLIFVGLILYYWVDKYNFLRRSTVKVGLGGKISSYSIKSLDATLFLVHGGHALFSYLIQQQVDALALLLMIFGLIYLFSPMTDIIWLLHQQRFTLEQKEYKDAKSRFKQNYLTLHPVYKRVFPDRTDTHRQSYRDQLNKQLKTLKHFNVGKGKFSSPQKPRNLKDTISISDNLNQKPQTIQK